MGYFYYALNGIKGVHSPRFCRFPPRFFPLKGSMLAKIYPPSVTPTVTPTPFFAIFRGRQEHQKCTVFTPFFVVRPGAV